MTVHYEEKHTNRPPVTTIPNRRSCFTATPCTVKIESSVSLSFMEMKLINLAAVGMILVMSAAGALAQSALKARSESLVEAPALLADVERLSADDMEGRSPDLPSIQKARDYVDERFRQSGLIPFGNSFRQEFSIKRLKQADTLPGVNFVGYIKGTKFPEKYIVVSAHYDHLGIRNGKIYNGADDDASGTAALFAMAKAFKHSPPDHTV